MAVLTLGSGLAAEPPCTAGGRERLMVAAQMSGLLATGWLTCRIAAGGFHPASLPWFLCRIAIFLALAWISGAAVTLGIVYLLPVEDRSQAAPTAFQTAASAIWIGLAVRLFADLSPVAILAAAASVAYSSRLLAAGWRSAATDGEFIEPNLFLVNLSYPSRPGFIRTLWLAVCLELCILSVLAGLELAATAFVLVGAAGAASLRSDSARVALPITLSGALARILVVTAFAGLLHVAGTGPSIQGSHRHVSFAEALRLLMASLSPDSFPDPAPPGQARTNGIDQDLAAGVSGVVLRRPIRHVTKLIDPPLASGIGQFFGRRADRAEIPFSGEYWMLRWLESKLPPEPLIKETEPSKVEFMTTDRQPLHMEARQKLESPIPTNCCRGIELHVVNADRFPGTVEIELTLMDRAAAGMNEYLGNAPILSRPEFAKGTVNGVREALRFRMPSRPSLRQFDEIRVVFLGAQERANKSPSISIERFTLLR